MSLVEVVVACGIASILALAVGGMVVSSAQVNRETWVENEVVSVAAQAADELAHALSQADRFTDAWDLSSAGDQLELQALWTNDTLQPVLGALLPVSSADPSRRQAGWAVRALWVPEATLPERGQIDIDGDGDAADTVAVGRLELRYYAAPANGGGAEVTLYRRRIGGGRVRFVQRAFDGAPSAPVRMFSRPPVTSAAGVDTPRLGEVVRTSDEVAAGGPSPDYPHGFGEPDPAVQLNLRVVYEPTPRGDGKVELHVFNVRRLVARR
jgi:type II secretory pathway pseudopilin PulG